jgi:chromosome segregation ATPase
MSDFKKSKSSDYRDSSNPGDLNSLLSELDEADKQADQEIQVLDTKRQELEELETQLAPITENLSEMEGEARAAVEAEITSKMEQKAGEIEQCEENLQEISQQMQEKQSEINEEIGKRETALSELESLEQDADVQLEEGKSEVEAEKQVLEEASAKVDGILDKIEGALSNGDEKKNSFLDNPSKALNNLLKEGTKSFRKGAAATMILTGSVAGFMTKVSLPLIDLNENIVKHKVVSKDSPFGKFADRLEKAKKLAPGSDLGEFDKLLTVKEEEDEKKKKQKLRENGQSLAGGSPK